MELAMVRILSRKLKRIILTHFLFSIVTQAGSVSTPEVNTRVIGAHTTTYGTLCSILTISMINCFLVHHGFHYHKSKIPLQSKALPLQKVIIQ